MNDIKLVASGFCKETEHSNLLLDYLVDTSKNRINTSFLRPLALHQNDAILTPSDETTTVTTMNFLTFEDNYLAGQSPERKIIMTNKEKALALIGTFVSGDTAKAKELLATGYIQHNLAFGTGADAFVAAVEGLAQAPVKTTVNNIRAFEDGDKVFLQTVYNFAGAGEQVGFDVFRFDADGKIAEHWDNLADKAALILQDILRLMELLRRKM